MKYKIVYEENLLGDAEEETIEATAVYVGQSGSIEFFEAGTGYASLILAPEVYRKIVLIKEPEITETDSPRPGDEDLAQ